jgi:uncharacterized protein (TIGR03067 family)
MISMAFLIRTASRFSARGLAAILVLALGAALIPGGATRAPAADDLSPADALKALKGTWVTEEGIDSSWTFEGETLKASVNGQDYNCKVKADPKAKPMTLDFLIDEGPEGSKGKTSKCIYKFEGEKLILCVSTPGKDRPKEFGQVEDEAYIFELKKEKPKEKAEKKEEKKS